MTWKSVQKSVQKACCVVLISLILVPIPKSDFLQLVMSWLQNSPSQHLYTVWLFTRSDLKTIIIPTSIFAILGALPRVQLTLPTGDSEWVILCRLPLVVIWVWLVLLPFNIDNQRRPDSIEEDKINRPWRPLPSKRLTPRQASRLMLVFHVITLSYSYVVGGLAQAIAGIFLGWLYNAVGGADYSWVTKNANNALGYVTFCTGATAVASRSEFTPRGLQWFSILAAMIFSTVHMQDLPDVKGDMMRGRRTVPLVFGDRPCRWSIALLVPLWGVATSTFWGFVSLPAVLCNILALIVFWRVLKKTSIHDDKVTFRLWNLWVICVYSLPLGEYAPVPADGGNLTLL